MTREEAIEVLRKLPVGLMDLRNEQKSDLTEAMESVFKICLDIVREASTIDPESLRPEWISVKDRLPEKTKTCWYLLNLGKWRLLFMRVVYIGISMLAMTVKEVTSRPERK